MAISEMGRGHKQCPCGEIVGPRTRVCPKCGHKFTFKVKKETKTAELTKAKRAAKKSKK